MSRYETILSLNENFLLLINKGLVPVHLLDWKVYYESYIEHCKIHKKYEAANIVAAHYDVSQRQMRRIVAYMKGA